MIRVSYVQMTREIPNALALEYQREYGTARGNLDLSDLVNNPSANGVCSVFGLSLSKEFPDRRLFDLGSIGDNGANTLLITQKTV